MCSKCVLKMKSLQNPKFQNQQYFKYFKYSDGSQDIISMN